MNFYNRLAFGLFLTCLSGFFITSLISFSPFDPSFFAFSSNQPSMSLNKAGIFGSFLASACYYFLGAASFLVFIFLIDAAVLIFLKKESFFSSSNYFFGWLLFFVAISTIVEDLKKEVILSAISFKGAGIFGELLSFWMDRQLGLYGKVLFLFFLFFAGLSLILNSRLLFLIKLFHRVFLKQKKKKVSTEKFQTLVKEEKKAAVNDTEKTIVDFVFEKSNFLNESLNDSEELENKKQKILSLLSEFHVTGKITFIQTGPSLYIFHFLADSGIKHSRVQTLSEDLALALKAASVTVEPIFEDSTIGIYVPREKRHLVRFGDILHHKNYDPLKAPLMLPIGLSPSSQLECCSLIHMPHLLIAGATGSGKSVAINGIICSLIAQNDPSQLKLILIDPKMLELSVYESIPHLLLPVITQPAKALSALKWCIEEMDARYELLQSKNVRSIEAYNALENKNLLPFIAVIIDELSDLLLTCSKEVEVLIQRLAQKSRACGIHMILATQRPSVDVITGVIKANLPARIAFQVASKHDSRTILDQIGAEKLLGKGDLLFLKPGALRPIRLQGGFISDEEVNAFVSCIKKKYPTKSHYIDLSSYEKQVEIEEKKEVLSVEQICRNAKSLALKNETIDAVFLKKHFALSHKQALAVMETINHVEPL